MGGGGAAGEASDAWCPPAVTHSRIHPSFLPTVTSDTPLLAPSAPQPQIQPLPGAPRLEMAPGSQKQLTTHASKLLHFFLPNTSEASALCSDHSFSGYFLKG